MNPDVTRRDWLKLGAVAGAGLLVTPRPEPAVGRPHRSPAGEELQDLLQELVTKHRMPGAIAGVSHGGEVLTATVGTANLSTNTPMRPDLAFIAGSITKVWTTTLAMTFVDDGTVQLDVPLVRYLPHLRFGDPAATQAVTLRNLLNHSSGLDVGDYFLDRGEGPCAHRIFVDTLASIGQIHRVGAYSSYCNGGFMIVAHLIETVSKSSWRKLLVERVIAPMGLTRTYVDAEDGVLHGMVVGNLPDPSVPGGFVQVPKLLLSRTMAPVGTTLIFNAGDLLAFARMHLAGGVADNGKRILSETSAKAMATRTIDPPAPVSPGFGLGWMHSIVDGRTILSHGGGSNGGRSLVMAIADLNLALASFVNTSSPGDFQNELHDRLTARYGAPGAHSATWVPARPPAGPVALGSFVGTFRRMTSRTTVRLEGGALKLENQFYPDEAEGTTGYGLDSAAAIDVVPIAPNALGVPGTTRLSRSSGWVFLDPDPQGRYRLLYEGGRLSKRIA